MSIVPLPLAEPLPTTSTPPALELESLSVSYGGRAVLRDVSLAAPAGSVTALVGPSGCGKTSLLNCLNRMTDLLPGCAVDGQVRLFGEDVRAPDRDLLALRRRVGLIFQRPNPFELSIRRNIDLPLRELGVRRPQARAERVERALRDVGLWPEVCHRLDRPALELSGGQRQRLCIARAIALEPQVLLMDEPCSSLDPQATAAIEALIESWRGRYTVLIVTHNLAQARRVADYTAVLWANDGVGRLVEHGPTAAVFDAPRHPAAADYLAGRSG